MYLVYTHRVTTETLDTDRVSWREKNTLELTVLRQSSSLAL